MIKGYCDYITRYIKDRKRTGFPTPGEHHFVSTYLVPKLFQLTAVIPDYVNPDGTKAILGDVVSTEIASITSESGEARNNSTNKKRIQ